MRATSPAAVPSSSRRCANAICSVAPLATPVTATVGLVKSRLAVTVRGHDVVGVVHDGAGHVVAGALAGDGLVAGARGDARHGSAVEVHRHRGVGPAGAAFMAGVTVGVMVVEPPASRLIVTDPAADTLPAGSVIVCDSVVVPVARHGLVGRAEVTPEVASVQVQCTVTEAECQPLELAGVVGAPVMVGGVRVDGDVGGGRGGVAGGVDRRAAERPVGAVARERRPVGAGRDAGGVRRHPGSAQEKLTGTGPVNHPDAGTVGVTAAMVGSVLSIDTDTWPVAELPATSVTSPVMSCAGPSSVTVEGAAQVATPEPPPSPHSQETSTSVRFQPLAFGAGEAEPTIEGEVPSMSTLTEFGGLDVAGDVHRPVLDGVVAVAGHVRGDARHRRGRRRSRSGSWPHRTGRPTASAAGSRRCWTTTRWSTPTWTGAVRSIFTVGDDAVVEFPATSATDSDVGQRCALTGDRRVRRAGRRRYPTGHRSSVQWTTTSPRYQPPSLASRWSALPDRAGVTWSMSMPDTVVEAVWPNSSTTVPVTDWSAALADSVTGAEHDTTEEPGQVKLTVTGPLFHPAAFAAGGHRRRDRRQRCDGDRHRGRRRVRGAVVGDERERVGARLTGRRGVGAGARGGAGHRALARQVLHVVGERVAVGVGAGDGDRLRPPLAATVTDCALADGGVVDDRDRHRRGRRAAERVRGPEGERVGPGLCPGPAV